MWHKCPSAKLLLCKMCHTAAAWKFNAAASLLKCQRKQRSGARNQESRLVIHSIFSNFANYQEDLVDLLELSDYNTQWSSFEFLCWYTMIWVTTQRNFLTFKLGDIFRVRCISGLILSQTWIFCCESMWWTRILDSGRRAGSWSPHGSLAPKHAYMTWLRCLGTQYCRYKKIHHLMQTAAASIDARHSAA